MTKAKPITIEKVLNQIKLCIAEYEESLDTKDEFQKQTSLHDLEQLVIKLKELNADI